MTDRLSGGDQERAATATSGAPLRVAVIDTDSGFLQVLTKRLERLGWEHRVLATPVPVETIVAMRLGAVVVDLASLGAHGWDYLERLCEALPGLGVVVCTGQSAESRGQGGAVVAGEIEIRSDRFQAFVGGRSVDLTRREFELIELLASAEGRVLEREEIYQRVWGYAMARGDRSVDVFVRKLRQKLERASPGWRYIHTHFGVGYRFAPVPLEGPDALAAGDPGEVREVREVLPSDVIAGRLPARAGSAR
jgi:DNA-binding response OmpR family regulator